MLAPVQPTLEYDQWRATLPTDPAQHLNPRWVSRLGTKRRYCPNLDPRSAMVLEEKEGLLVREDRVIELVVEMLPSPVEAQLSVACAQHWATRSLHRLVVFVAVPPHSSLTHGKAQL